MEPPVIMTVITAKVLLQATLPRAFTVRLLGALMAPDWAAARTKLA